MVSSPSRRIKQGANCRAAGEDVTKGRTKNRVCVCARGKSGSQRPSDAELQVFEKVRVVFSTGDEVGEPGDTLAAGKIYDPIAIPLCLHWNASAALSMILVYCGQSRRIAEAIRKTANHDLLVTSGGMSVGEEDHVGKTVSDQGLHFWRLAIKPGRPVSLGRVHAGAEARLLWSPRQPRRGNGHVLADRTALGTASRRGD